jgi:hypothetical protein
LGDSGTAGQAEVEQHRQSIAVAPQEVGGTDVAVEQVLAMQGHQHRQQLPQQQQHLAGAEHQLALAASLQQLVIGAAGLPIAHQPLPAAVLDHGKTVASGSMADLTASSEEVRFELAPGPVPIEAVRSIAGVKMASFDEAARVLRVLFDRSFGDAEEIIARVLGALLQANSRISGVSKGRGLEERVMELTDSP